MCTPTGPTGPVGNGNVVITPDDITMNLDGTFATSFVVTGLPPLTPIAGTTFSCGPPGGLSGTVLAGTTDALGRLQNTLSFSGAPGCVPGTYPIVFSETGPPFQNFTGFFTLHF